MTLPGLQRVSNSFQNMIEVRSGQLFISVQQTKGTFSLLSFLCMCSLCVCTCRPAIPKRCTRENRFMVVIHAVFESHVPRDDEFLYGCVSSVYSACLLHTMYTHSGTCRQRGNRGNCTNMIQVGVGQRVIKPRSLRGVPDITSRRNMNRSEIQRENCQSHTGQE